MNTAWSIRSRRTIRIITSKIRRKRNMLSINDSQFIKIYFCIIMAVTGSVFGSFLHCLAWRITHGERVTKGRSHCVECGHELGALDLVPVLSWLFLRGRCRYCGKKVALRYPLSELILGLLSVLLLLKFDLSVLMLRNLIFVYVLFTLTITDLYDFIIPDGCILTALVTWFVSALLMHQGLKELLTGLLTGLCFGAVLLLVVLIFDKIMKKESMGGGDIKLIAVSALYLGLFGSLFMMFGACIIGLLFALFTNYRKTNEEMHFPFGPAIALSTVIMLLYGSPLVGWYLSLF